MYDERFAGIANAVTLRLCVKDNGNRLSEIGEFVDINMAVSRPRLDYGHGCALLYGLNQSGAAARNQQIDIAVQPHERLRSLPRRIFDQRDGILFYSAGTQSLPKDADDRAVGMEGVRAPAQNYGVRSLKTKRKGVRGDVGA